MGRRGKSNGTGHGRGQGGGSGSGSGPGSVPGTGPGSGTGQGGGRHQRYIQATILMVLLGGPSHGYDLIPRIVDFGFLRAEVSPGMIYKHLRRMEEDGLLSSDWDAAGSGPAKRNYAITDAGREALEAWVAFMDRQAGLLGRFVAEYRSTG